MARMDPEQKLRRVNGALPKVRDLVQECRACGRACGAARTAGGTGACRASSAPGHVRYAAAVRHFGEEPMLVGRGGSGTVFFSHCSLRCVFCQNHQISQAGDGAEHTVAELARAFLDLRAEGAENINLVTPTQCILPILEALREAYAAGLDAPLVYNTNGYDAVELVEALADVVDVWLPDLKYMDPEPARRYSGTADYPETARAALRAMWRAAGPLRVDSDGKALGGVILRHLVLPENVSGTYDMLLWLHDEGMTDITLGLMSQYTPRHRAAEHAEIARPLAPREYNEVVDYAVSLGFEHLLVQEMESQETYLPDFRKDHPFEG
ncbi:MAG: radical SAM protein [Candidatus Hydrogenedentes bacterium]|nr:radical SAM protein [Candidatus Hydrogenedentota bacterium]